MDIFIYLAVAGFLFAIYWFVIRKPKAKTVKDIPIADALNPAWFEELPTASRAIWKLKDKNTQPSGTVECVAYSTQEMLESPPFNVSGVPSTGELFREIADYDKQENSKGLTYMGGMEYLKKHKHVSDYFNFSSRQQMVDFVKSYGTFQLMITLTENPRFKDGFWIGNEGRFAGNHSMVVYGCDTEIECPSAPAVLDDESGGVMFPAIAKSKGAFRVRWHIDFFGDGFIEGWFSFALADEIFIREWAFGYELK